MRTIKDLPAGVPKEVSAAYPDGAIINETAPDTGTPVVREIYQDVLSNIYAILRATGITPNGSEDNELTSYQLLAALQKLANTYNDIEQNLSSAGTVFSIALEIESRPDKYVLFAKALSGYNADLNYTFRGTGITTYSFSSPTGFAQGDEVILVLDKAGVRAYKLSAIGSNLQGTEIFPVLGTPLAFNNSKKLWYQSEGVLFSDAPEQYDLQGIIRFVESDASVIVYEMLAIGAYILCLSLRPATSVYRFYRFDANNLGTAPTLLAVAGLPASGSTNRQPYVYTDGSVLYITNNAGAVANNNILAKYALNLGAGAITAVGSVTLDATFRKTTNAVIFGSKLYTFISGFIEQYDLNTGAKANGINLPGNIGCLVAFGGSVYFCGVDAAKRWVLPVY
jgi:hypothetical protein